jgi:hypothetical protein
VARHIEKGILDLERFLVISAAAGGGAKQWRRGFSNQVNGDNWRQTP